jgi:hypothetical protein
MKSVHNTVSIAKKGAPVSPRSGAPESLITQQLASAFTRRRLLAGALLATTAGSSLALPSVLADSTPEPDSASIVDRSTVLLALAAAGISVFERPEDTEPLVPVESPGPLSLLTSQFDAMVAEASAGGGTLGAELDELTLNPALWEWPEDSNSLVTVPRLPLGVKEASPIPPSLLLAGYVAGADSPGAEFARTLMPDIDAARANEYSYPNLILTLFAAELARESANTSTTFVPGGLGVRALIQTGVCSSVQGFIDTTLNALFSALQVDLGNSVPGKILGGVINFLLGAAKAAVKEALNTLTAPVLSVVRTIAGVIGTASIVISALRPWTVIVTPSPSATRFSIGSESPIVGTVDVLVDLGGLDEFPPDVVDCANQVGMPLPPLKPEGAPCVWTVTSTGGAVAIVDTQSAALDASAQASLTYHTLSESEETAKGPLAQRLLRVTAGITRPQINELQAVLSNALFASLPAIVSTFVRPILGPVVDNLVSRLAALTETRASTAIVVSFHLPPDPTPTPEPEEPEGESASISAVFTSEQDVPFPVTIDIEAQTCDGIEWTGTAGIDLHIDGGVATLDIAETRPCSWTFADGDTTTTNIGPYRSQIIYELSPPDDYVLTLHATITRTTDGGGAALSFDLSATVSAAGMTQTNPISGASNLNVPIPVSPGNDNC